MDLQTAMGEQQAAITAQTAEQPVGPAVDHPSRVTVEKLKLLHDYLAIEPLAAPSKKGRVFMPDASSERERSHRGIVLAMGPGDFNEAGTALLPMTCDVGDLVFFGKYAGTVEEFGGREILVMRERELRLRISEGGYEVIRHAEKPKLSHLVEDWCEVCHGVPEEEAKRFLEQQQAAEAAKLTLLDDQVCSCGHTGAQHAHRTGPCRKCDDCLSFRGAAPELAAAAVASAAQRVSEDEIAALQAALTAADVQAPIITVEDATRKCPAAGGRCFFMQRMVTTIQGEFWVGPSCGHVLPAGLA